MEPVGETRHGNGCRKQTASLDVILYKDGMRLPHPQLITPAHAGKIFSGEQSSNNYRIYMVIPMERHQTAGWTQPVEDGCDDEYRDSLR